MEYVNYVLLLMTLMLLVIILMNVHNIIVEYRKVVNQNYQQEVKINRLLQELDKQQSIQDRDKVVRQLDAIAHHYQGDSIA